MEVSRETLRLKQGHSLQRIDLQITIDDYLSRESEEIAKLEDLTYPRGHWSSIRQTTVYSC